MQELLVLEIAKRSMSDARYSIDIHFENLSSVVFAYREPLRPLFPVVEVQL